MTLDAVDADDGDDGVLDYSITAVRGSEYGPGMSTVWCVSVLFTA